MRGTASSPYRLALGVTLISALLCAGCGGGQPFGSGDGSAGSSGSGGGATAGTGGAGARGTGGGEPSGSGGAPSGTGGAPSGSGGAPSGSGSGGGGPGSGGGPTAGSGGGAGRTGGGGTTGAGSGGRGTSTGSGGVVGAGGGGAGGVAMPSAGCGRTSPPASGRYSISVSGTNREYILKLPAGYDPAKPYRLILAWHGRMYSADWVSNGDPPQTGPYFGIESQAAGAAIFVAPQALETSWTNQGGRDVAFALAMIARFEAELCIDQSRIFSTGFSAGAMMTITLGCAEGDVFRAIAPMSGSLQTGCAAGNLPVAYWASNGDMDTTVPVATGQAARNEFATRNGCRSETAPTSRAGCVANQGCRSGYPVTFCVFSGVHEPPPFAGEAVWEFLKQF